MKRRCAIIAPTTRLAVGSIRPFALSVGRSSVLRTLLLRHPRPLLVRGALLPLQRRAPPDLVHHARQPSRLAPSDRPGADLVAVRELLREAARARRARDIEGPPIGVAAPGCLRAALLLMLFFLFVMFAVSTLLGSLFVSW